MQIFRQKNKTRKGGEVNFLERLSGYRVIEQISLVYLLADKLARHEDEGLEAEDDVPEEALLAVFEQLHLWREAAADC